VVELPKAAGAIDQEAAVYWDDSARAITTTATATDNTRISAATEAAASAAATVRVRLNGNF
jgi:predicted RecA/RadA family phage recombinase